MLKNQLEESKLKCEIEKQEIMKKYNLELSKVVSELSKNENKTQPNEKHINNKSVFLLFGVLVVVGVVIMLIYLNYP